MDKFRYTLTEFRVNGTHFRVTFKETFETFKEKLEGQIFNNGINISFNTAFNV